MSVLKNITPTPAQLSAAYREVFDSVIDAAGGKDGRISAAAAEKIGERSDAGKLVADNILNFLEKTGQKTVGVAKFQSVVADYVKREAEKAAGPNQRLSLVEIRNLPTDLVGDALHLRGRDGQTVVPTVRFNENDVYALLDAGGFSPERSVTSGNVTHNGQAVVLTGLTNVGEWQDVAETVLTKMWDRSFQHRVFNNQPIDIGPGGHGRLDIAPAVDATSGKEGLMVYWRDIDDDSFVWFFQKQDNGSFEEKHEVYLN